MTVLRSAARNTLLRSAIELILFSMALGFKGAVTVRMATIGRVFVVNSGEELRLECEFHADQFNLFDNPILWRKTQLDEATQINMMGNMVEPFESTHRFRVTLIQRPSRFLFSLYIAETYQEDSGNYTCEVSGPQNTLIGFVTHHIFVRAPIDSVLIDGGVSTTPDGVEMELTSERSLVFIEGTQAPLRCSAIGGYPPPDITIQLGQEDITNQLSLGHSVRLTGSRSLRVMHYTTARGLRSFNGRHEDDGKLIRCAVTVAGLMSNITFARVIVHYAPRISCDPSYASIGDRNARVKCEVKSKPDMTATFWIIDVNGTTLAEGEVINEYWSSVMYRTDGAFEMQLSLREAKVESFRKYTIVAENSVGVRTQDVHLIQISTSGTIASLDVNVNDIPPKMRVAVKETITNGPSRTGSRSVANLVSGALRRTAPSPASTSTALILLCVLLLVDFIPLLVRRS